MATGNTNFAKAKMLIRKPVSEVFQAFVNSEITSKFWFTNGSRNLEEDENPTKALQQRGFLHQ